MDIDLLEKSRVGLRLNLDAGVTVQLGSVVKASSTGVRFGLESTVSNTSGITGDIFGAGIALNSGVQVAAAGAIDTIVVPVTGWNSVTNDNDATLPGDINVSSGDLTLTSGVEAIRQNIQIRLKFFQGEWFLNTDIGIPYFGTFLTKNPNLAVVRSIIRDAVEGIPGVKSVTSVETQITTGSRDLQISLKVLSDLEEEVEFDDVLVF